MGRCLLLGGSNAKSNTLTISLTCKTQTCRTFMSDQQTLFQKKKTTSTSLIPEVSDQ